MLKVLLVEDNIKISQNIRQYLDAEFDIQPVYNGGDAIAYLDAYNYDMVILDLMLPEIDGMSILSYIAKNNLNTGVIILTAKEELGEKLKAFELGANDYLTKPFFMEELKARMNEILRRMGKIQRPNVLAFRDMYIDLKSKTVFIGDQDLKLNEKLYNLLEYLMLNKGVLLFKEQIFNNICGYDSDASIEIVEVYMSRLRKKLALFGYDKYLITKRGMGYLLDENAGD